MRHLKIVGYGKYLPQQKVVFNDEIRYRASAAMAVLMKKMGFKEEQFLDIISQYGNMVSVSVPFILCEALENGRAKQGDKIMLMRAAGLTMNLLYMQL